MVCTSNNPRQTESLEKYYEGFWRRWVIVGQTPTMSSLPPSDPLVRALADWRVAPSRNPQFRVLVQARLAGAGAELPWGAYARRLLAGVAGALAIALVLGALGGQEIARARAAVHRAQLATVYVQGLDARVMTMR